MLLVILFWVRFLSTYTLTIWLIYCKGSSDTENSEKGEIVRIGGIGYLFRIGSYSGYNSKSTMRSRPAKSLPRLVSTSTVKNWFDSVQPRRQNIDP